MKLTFWIVAIIGIVITFSSCKDTETKHTIKTDQSSGDMTVDQISAVLSKDPNNKQALIDRANRYAQLEAYDEAIIDLDKLIKLDSLNPGAYHLLADIYMDYYQSKKAIKTMDRVLEIHPDRIPSLLKLTEFYVIVKQYDHALVMIDKIAKIDPQNGEAAFMLGVIMKETGDLESAAKAFQKATEFDSDITDAWLMLGEIFESKNNPLAKRYYQNAIKSDTNSVSALHSLAYYEQNHNKIDKALDLYKQIIIKQKDYKPAYLNTGILLLEQKEYEKSIANFDILTSFAPNSHLAYYFKGIAYEALGNIKMAKDNYQNCLNFNHEHKESKLALEALK